MQLESGTQKIPHPPPPSPKGPFVLSLQSNDVKNFQETSRRVFRRLLRTVDVPLWLHHDSISPLPICLKDVLLGFPLCF